MHPNISAKADAKHLGFRYSCFVSGEDGMMSGRGCNYQKKLKVEDISSVLADAKCQHCGATASSLMLKGELLEICAEEFASDIESGERILVPVGLCPACHWMHHLDARGEHNPCQIKARLSREGLA